MQDVAPRRERTDDFDLHAIECRHLIGRIAVEVGAVRRVGFGDGARWQIDLGEVAILHAPGDIAPGFVELANITIALRQPVTKADKRLVRVEHRVVAAILVVGLPGGDARMLAKACRKRRHDPRAFAPVSSMGETVVTARGEPARAAASIDRQHVGHGVDQPFRRRRRRRTECDFKPGAVKRIEGTAEPVEIEMAGTGAQGATTRTHRSGRA